MDFALVEFKDDRSLAILSVQALDGSITADSIGKTTIANWKRPGSKKTCRYHVEIINLSDSRDALNNELNKLTTGLTSEKYGGALGKGMREKRPKRDDSSSEESDDEATVRVQPVKKSKVCKEQNKTLMEVIRNRHSNLDEGGFAQEIRALNKTMLDISQQNEAMRVAVCKSMKAICELTSVLKEVTNKRPSLLSTSDDIFSSNESVTLSSSASTSSGHRTFQTPTSSRFTASSHASVASTPSRQLYNSTTQPLNSAHGITPVSRFDEGDDDLFDSTESPDQKNLALVLRTCNREGRSKMVNDIMGGLFDVDYMSSHTVAEVTAGKQPMDKVLLESIIRSVKAQFPGVTAATIKMDIRQKLQNAVKTVRRNEEKSKNQPAE